MTNEFDLANNNREDLIFEKQDLLAPIGPDMVPPPHSMVTGTTEKDYYDGKVTGATEQQRNEVAETHGAGVTSEGEQQ